MAASSSRLRTANDATVFNSSASQPTANAELRIANNGIAYSRAEFEDFYGRNWERKWSEALRSNGHEEGQRGCAPQPTVTNTTSTDTIQLTWAQLEDRQPTNGVGGKFACAKQRELREQAMEQRVYEYDLTHSSWPWKDVLRALPEEMRPLLAGPGITKFSFRLLRGVLDHNYQNRDSGERHVFEIQHADGARYQLHYHKDGRLDNPTFVPSNDQSDPMGGASQPANGPLCHQDRDVTYRVEDCEVVAKLDMLTPNPPGPAIGRKSAFCACNVLLQLCAGVEQCAIDITDRRAFQWFRWLTNTAEAREALAVNVVRVFIVRWDRNEEPCFMMCREDSSYVCLVPTDPKKKRIASLEVHTDWPSLQILRNPWYVSEDWLKVRANAV